jgi:hypothetical protein
MGKKEGRKKTGWTRLEGGHSGLVDNELTDSVQRGPSCFPAIGMI